MKKIVPFFILLIYILISTNSVTAEEKSPEITFNGIVYNCDQLKVKFENNEEMSFIEKVIHGSCEKERQGIKLTLDTD